MKYKDCLKLPMQENDAGAKTIGEYIKKLLLKLWDEKEEFSVKRPFGNSGWDYELYYALANEGVISCRFDSYGDLAEFDEDGANDVIREIITTIFNEVTENE